MICQVRVANGEFLVYGFGCFMFLFKGLFEMPGNGSETIGAGVVASVVT